MDIRSIPLSEGASRLNLQATLESAQSFLWKRTDGQMYEEPSSALGNSWYYTVTRSGIVFARQRDDQLEWRATTDASELLRHRLRLNDDLEEIFATFPEHPALERARRAFPGLRVIRDPFFPCLISFICSARMPVARIHAIQHDIAQEFGDSISVNGSTYHAFPTPNQLAKASEEELRELGLGFRAPYIVETTRMILSGEDELVRIRNEPYHEARESLQSFMGVGPKIADCVSLFALGHLEAVPIDVWTRRLIERYFPEDAVSSYWATASAFRARFGEYAGYAQTYLYHCERSEEAS